MPRIKRGHVNPRQPLIVHCAVQGHIINVSSIAAHEHYAGGSVYCGTKAFVSAFTNATRHDLVGTNVRYAET